MLSGKRAKQGDAHPIIITITIVIIKAKKSKWIPHFA